MRVTMPIMFWKYRILKKAVLFSLWYYLMALVFAVVLIFVLNYDNPVRQMQLLTYFLFIAIRGKFVFAAMASVFVVSLLFVAWFDGTSNRFIHMRFAELLDGKVSWFLAKTHHSPKHARRIGRVEYTEKDLVDAVVSGLDRQLKDFCLTCRMRSMEKAAKRAEQSLTNEGTSMLMAARAVNRYEYEAGRFLSLLFRIIRITNLHEDIGISEDSFVRLENELNEGVKQNVVLLRQRVDQKRK